MTDNDTWRARRIGFMHRYHARRAGRADITTSFRVPPEPRTIGLPERGKQLLAGQFLFSGLRIDGVNRSIWTIAEENAAIFDEIQRFAWLDDLAALGDELAREKAQRWVFAWVERYGDGRSGGWRPSTVGRRLIRLIDHSAFLLGNQDKTTANRLLTSLGQQTLFVARRWKTTAHGLKRFEALASTIHASLALEGLEGHAASAILALADDCSTQVDAKGAIATRNPEELLEIVRLLSTATVAMERTDQTVPAPISDAIARIIPTLRGLRHADGGLPRFHGGGRGFPGRLDEALVGSGVKALPSSDINMGFARMSGGRSSVIVDAAPPPARPVSAKAHASTLAFELTSGRRPVIVNCGSGRRFGGDWRRASRATASHSTATFDGTSSSEIMAPSEGSGTSELLRHQPDKVICNYVDTDNGTKIELSHNGFRRSHGLTHARTLNLTFDGRTLIGEEHLVTLSRADETAFDKAQKKKPLQFSIRFHLHPGVEASINADQTVVALKLKSGEVWRFDHDGVAKLGLMPSVYFKNGQLNPFATQQVVLSGTAMSYATRVRWSLAKTYDTPDAMRDLEQSDL